MTANLQKDELTQVRRRLIPKPVTSCDSQILPQAPSKINESREMVAPPAENERLLPSSFGSQKVQRILLLLVLSAMSDKFVSSGQVSLSILGVPPHLPTIIAITETFLKKGKM